MRSPGPVQLSGVKYPVLERNIGLDILIDLGLDQFAVEIKFAFCLAESTSKGLPVFEAGVQVVIRFDHSEKAEILLVDPKLVGPLPADDINGAALPIVLAGLSEVEVQGVAEDMAGLVQRIEVHATEEEDETFVIIVGGRSQLAVVKPIGGITAEDDCVAAVRNTKVHAKAIRELDEFMPDLGGSQGIVLVLLGGLGEGEGMVPLAGVAVVHFLDDVMAGRGEKQQGHEE